MPWLPGLCVVFALAVPGPADVDFAEQVLPVLQARCTSCHGAARQKAGLRLDTRAAALAGRDFGERPVIVPGDAQASTLWQRIVHDDPFERMPPDGAPLDAGQRDAFRRWIEAGAPWPDELAGAEGVAAHWAYTAPTSPVVPDVPGADHPVDAFVRRRLDDAPSAPQAAPAELVRRVALDLTGLPPSLEQVRAFEADPSDAAYERLVDELLASPHHGEHRARAWLDLARYADSQGYEKDDRRTMWRWRDWVIDACNADMPFDRFTVEQLAGDLLPEPDRDQLVATGFHRNTMTNREGGTDPEEFRVAAVVDRVDTTATVWMGTSLGCARCHDHKYDPFTQREYYALYAFFDQTEDAGDSDAPFIEAPDAALEAEVARIEAEIARLDGRLATSTPDLDAERARWLRARGPGPDWRRLRPERARAGSGARLAVLDDDSLLALGEVPSTDVYEVALPLPGGGAPLTALRLAVLADPSLPGEGGPGRMAHGNFVLNELTVERVAPDGSATAVTLGDARADHEQGGSPPWPAADAVDGEARSGWAVGGAVGRDHRLVVTFARPWTPGVGERLRVGLHQGYGSGHVIGRLALEVTSSAVPAAPPLPADVEAILAVPEGARSGDDVQRLDAWFRTVAPSLEAVRRARAALRRPVVPTALVMREREEPRTTRVLERGSFLSPGEVVRPGVPRVLPALADGAATRLDLARWLVSPEHPLTARVAVNRFWSRLFGTGLVSTEDDFGTQGEAPSHPRLLDWLACEFQRTWSVKSLLRTIVTSRTYRQSSSASPEAWAEDPFNRRLARGPRMRVDAETLRDVALSASGLLSREVGGPSVFPPQPEGTWAMTYSADRWATSVGPDRYRRGLYTFWRRTAPYPTFMLFDAPSRELVCARRDRTDTPLQALATLNDPVFVECARALARRLLSAPAADDEQRVELGFRLCVARAPGAGERSVLASLLADERAAFTREPRRAAALVPDAGHGVDPVELAAWTVVANVLLNLDETVTKG